MSPALGARLRAATGALHRQAERTPFMAALIAGRLDGHSYVLMLRNLEAIYTALEVGLLVHAKHPAIAPWIQPALFRAGPLQADLGALHGGDWQGSLALLPACERYAQRLREIAGTDPALLAAHAYVRYLGDLSGGQILKSVVTRSLGLAPQAPGTAFYDFGTPQQAAALAQSLRSGLDQAEPAMPDSQAVVQEAVDAFELHCELFGEMAAAGGAAA